MKNIKLEMYHMLEKINFLEERVEAGKRAEEDLKILNKNFKKLCEEALEEERNV